jgi:hypothetical protein
VFADLTMHGLMEFFQADIFLNYNYNINVKHNILPVIPLGIFSTEALSLNLTRLRAHGQYRKVYL